MLALTSSGVTSDVTHDLAIACCMTGSPEAQSLVQGSTTLRNAVNKQHAHKDNSMDTSWVTQLALTACMTAPISFPTNGG